MTTSVPPSPLRPSLRPPRCAPLRANTLRRNTGLSPPRTRRRKPPLGRFLPERFFELPTLSERGVARLRKRGGLNEIDSGVPQVSGAASHRLSLSGRSADRRAGRRGPSTFYRDICQGRKVRKTNRKKKKFQLLLLPGPLCLH